MEKLIKIWKSNAILYLLLVLTLAACAYTMIFAARDCNLHWEEEFKEKCSIKIEQINFTRGDIFDYQNTIKDTKG